MKPKHITDWEKAGRLKSYDQRTKAEERLVGQWMEHEWSTVVFGQMVRGELEQVDYACVVTFFLRVPHGEKTLHIEGPYEEFLPVEDKGGKA